MGGCSCDWAAATGRALSHLAVLVIALSVRPCVCRWAGASCHRTGHWLDNARPRAAAPGPGPARDEDSISAVSCRSRSLLLSPERWLSHAMYKYTSGRTQSDRAELPSFATNRTQHCHIDNNRQESGLFTLGRFPPDTDTPSATSFKTRN